MAIGIPSGIENGMFQFGKLAIQSTVSAMGTTAIAATGNDKYFGKCKWYLWYRGGDGLLLVMYVCRLDDKKCYFCR